MGGRVEPPGGLATPGRARIEIPGIFLRNTAPRWSAWASHPRHPTEVPMRVRPSPISVPGSLLAVLLLSDAASSQTTSRLSLGPGSVEGNGFSVSPAVSSDGRYVVFASGASDLVSGDVNGV